MTSKRRLLPIVLASLLAACATTPSPKPKHTQPLPSSTEFPASSPPAALSSPVESPSLAPLPDTTTMGTVWDRLRGSFAMADCDADPQIMVWAHRYTQNPQYFEAQMQGALSQLVYVQQIAQKYGVAGEFVLLPWVESEYRPVPGHRNLPAGMWQLVQSTARVIGLHMAHGYDGRLDTSASTEGVMRMLRDYYNQLHDWRLVDYAFNRGEYGIQQLVQRHGIPPDDPIIPTLPVPRITREHLTKLLAISCVVREPSRFHVELPTLPVDQHLETVKVQHGTLLSNAADQAGMDMNALRRLNPALQGDYLQRNAPGMLLMPRRNAEQLRNAMQIASAQDMMASASISTGSPSITYTANAPQPQEPVTKTHARTHVVRSGESLWQIARHYSISVSVLKRLNHLRGNTLKPGQVLKLDR